MLPQTPWIERKFNFDFPIGLFPVIFSRLEGTIFRLQAMLYAADDEQCSVRNEGWSVKEHIGHLYDLEELWWKRLIDFQQRKHVLTAADITNQRTTEAGHNEKTLEALVQQFTMERQRMLEAVYDFEPSVLSLIAIHPRLNQAFRLIDSLYFVAEHDDHHLAVMGNMIRKPVG